jgi:TRAP-type C4-dicarboxylate transport system substrate-binding protein
VTEISRISHIIVLLMLVMSVQVRAETVKLGTLAPEGSPWHDVLRDMAQAWKAVSNGEITIRIYPGGVAGDEPDMVRKIRVGQLQAAALSGFGLTRIASEVQGLQMPMMFRSAAELDFVRERISPRIEAIFEDRGFKLLTWGDAGWVHFFTQRPVVHPDDLKSQRLFAWAGDTAHIEAWKDAGYQPVPLAATEIHTALQSGLINAFTATPVAALSFQWFGLANNMTDVKWAPLVGGVVVSTRSWAKIPDPLKPRLLDIAREAGARLNAMIPGLEARAIEAMQQHGLVVHPVPPDIHDEWEVRARAAYPKLVGTLVPADMLAKVEALREEYRSAAR